MIGARVLNEFADGLTRSQRIVFALKILLASFGKPVVERPRPARKAQKGNKSGTTVRQRKRKVVG